MLVGTSPRRVAVIGGVRIPFARGNGAYARVGNQEMLTDGLARCGRALRVERPAARRGGGGRRHEALEPMEPDARIRARLGPRRGNPRARPAARLRHEPRGRHRDGQQNRARARSTAPSPPAWTRSAIRPSSTPRPSSSSCSRAIAARRAGERIGPWLGLRMRHFRPVLPGTAEPRTGLSMGESTELMVKTWGIGRAEQDQLALESHQKAAAAYAQGFYKDLVRDYLGLSQDNNIRADTSLEKLAKLRAGVRLLGRRHADRGQLHAHDRRRVGRAAGVGRLGAGAQSARARLPCVCEGRRGRLRREEGRAVDGAGLRRTAHAQGCRTAACRISTSTRFTRHSPDRCFAPSRPGTIRRSAGRSWGFPRRSAPSIERKLNVKGGSLAIGHPFAATGSRIVATLAKILDENKAKRGLISVCTAGGMGVTAILER